MVLQREAMDRATITPKRENPTHPARAEDFQDRPRFDLVVLFSGGADSILMMELAQIFGYSPFCVLIDYEQLHIDELRFAEKYLMEREIPSKTVRLHGLGVQSGLTGRGEKGRFDGVHEMHVPSRNLMFIGIAASIAEDLGVDLVWMGADFSDYLNEILKVNGPSQIKLEAPLLGIHKDNIIKILERRGVDKKEMYSGYGDL